jgi:hypothetical protein
MRRVGQEILCVGGNTNITIKDKLTNEIKKIQIIDLYKQFEIEKTLLNNNRLQILTSENKFVDFKGIKKTNKNTYLKITLEDGNKITCSEDHIFIVSQKNMTANSLTPNISYLSTIDGDKTIISIEKINEDIELYDIVECDEGYEYLTNDIISHNCDFLGSGDNFIAEKYLKDIEDNQIKEPIRKEYVDREMWIFEDPIPEDEYLITIDVSAGHGDDSSSISVLKVKQTLEETLQEKPDGSKKKIKTIIHKAEQVAEYHNKVTPQILAEIVYYYAKLYNNAYVVIDVTGGYGVFTIETLLNYGYENIYYSEIEHKQTRERLGGYVKSESKIKSDGSVHNIDLVPGFFIGANRPQVLLNIQKFIHFGDIIIRSVRLLNELKTFINVSGSRIADHRRSFHDDLIMGMAIGLHVLSFDTKRFNKKDNEKTKKMMNAILTMNDINELNKDKPKPIPKIAYGYNPYREFGWVFKGMKGC